MWLILLCSVIAGAVFFERAAYFYRATIRVGEFMRGLTNLIQHRRWAEAQMECAATPSPVTRVIHAAILRHDAPRVELKEIVQETGQLEVPRLERRLAILATIGLVTPLIGFLGTVVGLIEAFVNISSKAATPARRTSPAASTRACSRPPPASSSRSPVSSRTPISLRG